MIHGFNTKTARVLIAQSVASTATVTGTVDTQDFDFMALDIDIGTASTNPKDMNLSEATTSDGTYTNVTGFVGTGDAGFTVPAADTSNDQTIRFNVALANRERYLKLTFTPGATQLMSSNARLWQKDETPDTDALQGCTEVVTG